MLEKYAPLAAYVARLKARPKIARALREELELCGKERARRAAGGGGHGRIVKAKGYLQRSGV